MTQTKIYMHTQMYRHVNTCTYFKNNTVVTELISFLELTQRNLIGFCSMFSHTPSTETLT